MTLLRAILWWIACALAAVYCGFLLAGCSATPYWVRDAEPVPVLAVVEVDVVRCGGEALGLLGCANRHTGRIEIKRGHPLRDCIETHERRHLEKGESHDNRPTFAYDCGDGRVIPGGKHD